jgi:hypothetical protein
MAPHFNENLTGIIQIPATAIGEQVETLPVAKEGGW